MGSGEMGMIASVYKISVAGEKYILNLESLHNSVNILKPISHLCLGLFLDFLFHSTYMIDPYIYIYTRTTLLITLAF